jgi:hypothetical protein
MKKPDTWYAYFCVRGTFAPDDVTRRVGVTPTETAREGDAIGTTPYSRPCSLWALHSRLGESAPLEEQVVQVLTSSPVIVGEKVRREWLDFSGWQLPPANRFAPPDGNRSRLFLSNENPASSRSAPVPLPEF